MRSGPKFSAIVLVILELILCLLIYIACVCIRRRRCRGATTGAVLPRSSNSSGSTGSPLARPGSEPVLVFFPYKVLKGLFPLGVELGSLQCAACLEEFKEDENETLRFIHKCGHVFHHACVDPFVGSCPSCRAEGEPGLRPDDGEGELVVEIEGMIKLPEEVREKITVHGKLVLPRWEPCSTIGYR